MNLKYVNLVSLFPVSALHCLKTITWNHLIKKKKVPLSEMARKMSV